ncbi:MAG: type I glutamate--ammonia ligase [Candidatus Omnitrophica bacterium]|nr:type I glutamate--ammonia ligase [Candidatus Omnitrophota bacterium]
MPAAIKRLLRKDKQYVLRLAKEHDVRFIRLWFTDILGMLKSFAITIDELEKALEEGMGFDGSSIEGFARIDESDMLALPDPNTFCILPWRPKENAVARMFCDVTYPGGKLFEGDPRSVLKRNLAHASKLGLTFYVGPELEFFFFKSSEAPVPIDVGGYFDLTPLDAASDIRRDIILAMEEMGIGVEYSHHEAAPSQHEIDFRYTDALTMADNVMTYRLVVKEIAFKHGVYASFMPKPMSGHNGSGMHVNMSLFRGPRNAFFDANDRMHLSKTAKQFMAGLLAHAPEMTLVLNQWVNSYKRLVPGFEAPVYVTWATRNRSDLIRIPMYKPGKEEAARIELRSPDPACNPYLAFSVILAAGLEGIGQKLSAPEPTEENVFALSDEERQRRRIAQLPSHLGAAIELARGSALLKRALGEHVYHSFLQNKQIEYNRFCAALTDYELKTYFPLL